jgi:hypothetical protein
MHNSVRVKSTPSLNSKTPSLLRKRVCPKAALAHMENAEDDLRAHQGSIQGDSIGANTNHPIFVPKQLRSRSWPTLKSTKKGFLAGDAWVSKTNKSTIRFLTSSTAFLKNFRRAPSASRSP